MQCHKQLLEGEVGVDPEVAEVAGAGEVEGQGEGEDLCEEIGQFIGWCITL